MVPSTSRRCRLLSGWSCLLVLSASLQLGRTSQGGAARTRSPLRLPLLKSTRLPNCGPPSSGPDSSRPEMRSRCARRDSGGVEPRPCRLSPFRRGRRGPAGGRGAHSGLVVAAAGAALPPPGNARPGPGRQSRAARPGPTIPSWGLEGRGNH